MTDQSRDAFEEYLDNSVTDTHGKYIGDAYDLWQAATVAERERCAIVCEAQHEGDSIDDDFTEPAYNAALRHARAAIRQGGDA